MFENLSERLSGVFDGLLGQATLSEQDVSAAMREVRLALLEADVALPIVKSFIRTASKRATGKAVMRSVKPADQIIKIVHDELISLLNGAGEQPPDMRLEDPPATILMVGLQGSGKTTTTAKLARTLTRLARKKVLMASLDIHRPAAMQQLQVLGEQAEIDTLPIIPDTSAQAIAKRAVTQAESGGYDILILDTAGRLHIDQELMQEVVEIRNIANPKETLLVLDGLTGQDAVNTAGEFESQVGITGVVLTRMEGDSRGGAALSMRAVTGKPIRFVGTGEKLEDLETFEATRIANRILGMGDIISLVEKAAQAFEVEAIERTKRRLQKGVFNMNDYRGHITNVVKMGGLQSVMAGFPMSRAMPKVNQSNFDDGILYRQLALIDSMTKQERVNPSILKASRRQRIANGAGLQVADVNTLMKSYLSMSKMMKGFLKKSGGLAQVMESLGVDDKADDSPLDKNSINQVINAIRQ